MNLARNILEKIGLKFGKLRYGIRCFLSTQIKKTSIEKLYESKLIENRLHVGSLIVHNT